MSAARRNPKLPPLEVQRLRSTWREPKSYAEERTNLELMGYYADDAAEDVQALYSATRAKWGVPDLRVVRPGSAYDFAAATIAQGDRAHARRALDFEAAPRMPWPSLHRAIDHGLLPDHLWVAAADSGQGKTTWIMSLAERWMAEGRRVFGLPLEQGVDTTRIYLAALATGVEVKRALKNRVSPAEDAALRAHLDWQVSPEGARLLHLHDEGRVRPRDLPMLYRRAVDFGAEVFFVDHIHRLRVSSHNEYADACSTLKELAKRHKVPCLSTAQNHRGIGMSDRLKAHLVPDVDRIQNGKVLEQESDLVLGLYRPLAADVDEETLKELRRGRLPVGPYLAPGVVGVAILKARLEGNPGTVVNLRWERGRIVDPEEVAQEQLENRYSL